MTKAQTRLQKLSCCLLMSSGISGRGQEGRSQGSNGGQRAKVKQGTQHKDHGEGWSEARRRSEDEAVGTEEKEQEAAMGELQIHTHTHTHCFQMVRFKTHILVCEPSLLNTKPSTFNGNVQKHKQGRGGLRFPRRCGSPTGNGRAAAIWKRAGKNRQGEKVILLLPGTKRTSCKPETRSTSSLGFTAPQGGAASCLAFRVERSSSILPSSSSGGGREGGREPLTHSSAALKCQA